MPDRVVRLSAQLVDVHQSLRGRLTGLRDALTRNTASSPAQIAGDLLTYCAGFCGALHAHHAGEDGELLPWLRAAAPELGPVIDRLIEDHALVAGVLTRIGELAGPGSGDARPDELIRELDGLAAILESHFGYEERRIGRALDSLGPDARVASVFASRPGRAGPD